MANKSKDKKSTLVESVYQSMDTLFSNNYTLGNIKYVTEDMDTADNDSDNDNDNKNFVDLMAKYEENEDINNHSENLLLLAKAVGDEDDIELADKMLKRRDQLGHFDNAFYDERNVLQNKLWPKFVAAYDAEVGNENEVNEDVDSSGNTEEKHWYTSSSGKLEFQMTLDQAESVSQPGKDAEEDVRELMRDPDMKEVVDYLFDNMDSVKQELKETGAWDEEDLEDEDMNVVRILWLAGNQISEDAFMNSDNEMKENIEENGKIMKESKGNLLASNVMDSRDIIERINELESDEENLDDSEKEELGFLKEFEDEGIPEWEDGAQLISYDYWTDYVKEMLEDVGTIPKDFPHYIAIDWEKTADNISQDYGTISVNGNEWYYRY